VFYKQMLNKKLVLIMFGFTVNPELMFRNILIAVMLSEIGKFFIDVTADVTTVNEPDLQFTALLQLLKVRQF